MMRHMIRMMTDMTPVVSVIIWIMTDTIRMVRDMTAMRMISNAVVIVMIAVTWDKSGMMRDTS
jgi:hypothetical protein